VTHYINKQGLVIEAIQWSPGSYNNDEISARFPVHVEKVDDDYMLCGNPDGAELTPLWGGDWIFIGLDGEVATMDYDVFRDEFRPLAISDFVALRDKLNSMELEVIQNNIEKG